MRKKNLILIVLICSVNTAVYDVTAEEDSTYSSLSGLVGETLDSNPGVQSAQAALDAATAFERAGNQPLYNPEVEIDAEDAIDQSAYIGISQSIDWNDKRSARGGIASYERDFVVAELHRIRQELAIELLYAVTQRDVTQRLFKLASNLMNEMKSDSNDHRMLIHRLCHDCYLSLRYDYPEFQSFHAHRHV